MAALFTRSNRLALVQLAEKIAKRVGRGDRRTARRLATIGLQVAQSENPDEDGRDDIGDELRPGDFGHAPRLGTGL